MDEINKRAYFNSKMNIKQSQVTLKENDKL